MRAIKRIALCVGCASACHPVATQIDAGKLDAAGAPCEGARVVLERVLADCTVSTSRLSERPLEGTHDPNELRVDVRPDERRVNAGAILDIDVAYVNDRAAETEFVLYGVPDILAWDIARQPVRVVPRGMEDVDGPCWSDIAPPATAPVKAVVQLAGHGRIDATLHWRANRRTLSRAHGLGCEWSERPLERGTYQLYIQDLDPQTGHYSDRPITVHVE